MIAVSPRSSFTLYSAVLAVTMLLAGIPKAAADIPRTLSVQGVLADGTGKPKANATYSITFRLYDALTGGNLLWTEAAKPVAVNGGKGQFTLLLGSPTAFGSLAFDKPYFLEVQAPGDPAMAPRLPLSTVPYALRAGEASLTLPFSGTADSNTAAFKVTSTGPGGSAVEGYSTSGDGVYGRTLGDGQPGVVGVSRGFNQPGNGVLGESYNGGSGVAGTSANTGPGVSGYSTLGYGVYGETASNAPAVFGNHTGQYSVGAGVEGHSVSFNGVLGYSAAAGHAGVAGVSNGTSAGNGLYGRSDNGGVGVVGISTNGGTAVMAQSGTTGMLFAGYNSTARVFRADTAGRVFANGNFQAGGADVAEFIASSDDPQPGDVVEIDPDRDGHFRRSRTANSTTVAGVVSTVPGVSMGAVQPADRENAGPQLALVGRVPVHASAENGPIVRGDLLTSSSVPGHAMRAPAHAEQGTVIGKSLGNLARGTGTVEMLVMLR